MANLERQFLPGISWDNRGEWHIAHIRPLCSFEFTSPDDLQFREAWALTNLRPLWARDNLPKGGRLDSLLYKVKPRGRRQLRGLPHQSRRKYKGKHDMQCKK